MRWSVLVAVPALLGAAPARLADLSGRYSATHPIPPHDGIATADTVVEIVPVAPSAAYVRIHYDNGGICGFAKVATFARGVLRYSEPDCAMTIRHAGRLLRVESRSCQSYCGVSAGLSDASVPFASRRPITYLARLKASRQYQDALAVWHR